MIRCFFVDIDGIRLSSKTEALAMNEARSAIFEVCDSTEAEVRRFLPMLPETLELEVEAGSGVIRETGELGAAVSLQRMRWTVDPSRPEGIASIARRQLRYTLFHEMHHCARGWVLRGGSLRTSFMDGVVAEGLATAFERDAGGSRPPWGEYTQEAQEWISELQRLPLTAPYREWMFRHRDGRRWIGYRAGTCIADRAIRASGLSAAKLVNVATSDVLRMAGVGRG